MKVLQGLLVRAWQPGAKSPTACAERDAMGGVETEGPSLCLGSLEASTLDQGMKTASSIPGRAPNGSAGPLFGGKIIPRSSARLGASLQAITTHTG